MKRNSKSSKLDMEDSTLDQDVDIKKDIISEQTFSKEQEKFQTQADREWDEREPSLIEVGADDLNSATSPQADSPGDSEEDATTEFMMGLNYRPPGEDEFEEEENDEIENFEKSDRTVYAEQNSHSASETPSVARAADGTFPNRDIELLRAKDAQVVASGRPSPRSDANSTTSSN